MATAIVPLASAGGCPGCCPKWVVDCCGYRNCGLPTRLLLSSSIGSQHLLFDGVGWLGSLQFDPDPPCVGELVFFMSCENGIWFLNGAPALEVNCKPFNATFLIEGTGEIPDIVATVTEEEISKCYGCCNCFPDLGIYLRGPVAYGDGYCIGGDALYGAERELFIAEGRSCVGLIALPDKGLGSEFLPDFNPCLCEVAPGFEGPYTPYFSLFFEPDGDDCRVVVTHKIGHFCAEPFICELFGRWSRVITDDECRNFYGGALELTLEEGGEFAEAPETINLEIE